MFGLQGSLLGSLEPSFDSGFTGLTRTWLDATSWLDVQPTWLVGADEVFARLAATLPWAQRPVTMYDRRVLEPRLTWWDDASAPLPPGLGLLLELRDALAERYDVPFDSLSCNWYRDGHDSVAWHRDRVRRHRADPLVAIVSVGEPRPFLVRPYGGGPSRSWRLGAGDLSVMGGAFQHDWEHGVPKVARAGPRISIMFRVAADFRDAP